jgi:phosphoesterase RecJ-like protein
MERYSKHTLYDIILCSANSEVFMKTDLKKLIKNNDKIIILRHKDPDLDAYGSQFGLYYALKQAYPDKKILAVGDTNTLNNSWPLDLANREEYRESLVFILDTVARQMLKGDDYIEAKTLVLIDHHINQPDIRYDHYVKDINASSCSEIVFHLLQKMKIKIPIQAAQALYMGIVSDTGRFIFNNTNATTFETAGALLRLGVDIQGAYDAMYAESLSMKRLKALFFNTVSYTEHNVAYRKNDSDFMKDHDVDVHTVSRGLVNQMAGAFEVPIWANFTFDDRIGKILCELRARTISIIEVARKYGGGGHAQACGCTVDTWEDTDKVLKDLDQIAEAIHG